MARRTAHVKSPQGNEKMKKARILRLLAAFAWVNAIVSGCAATQSPQPALWTGWRTETPAKAAPSATQSAIDDLSAGNLNKAEIRLAQPSAAAPTAADLCLYAEIPALRGDYKTAIARYVSALESGLLGDFEAIALSRLRMIDALTVESLPWEALKNLRATHPYALARLVALQGRAARQARIGDFAPANGAVALSRFKWAGPFSPYPSAEFDCIMPFDGDARLKDAYEIESSQTPIESFRYAPDAQTVMAAARAGIYAGETFFSVDRPGTYLAVIQSTHFYELSIDNQTVLRRGPELTGKDSLRAVSLRLSEGTHALRVKLGLKAGAGKSSPILIWIAPQTADGENYAKNAEAIGEDVPSIAEIGEPPETSAESSAAPDVIAYKTVDIASVIGDGTDGAFDASDAVMAWFGAALAIADGRADRADSMISARLALHPGDIVAQYWRALRFKTDADLASSLRHEKAMQIWQEIAEKAPEATSVQSWMIAETARQKQPKETLNLWNAYRAQLPDTADNALLESEVAKTLDWTEYADKRIRDAAQLAPESCPTAVLALNSAAAQHRYASFDALTPAIRKCPGVIRFYAGREGDGFAADPKKWDNALEDLAKQYPNDAKLRFEVLRNRLQTGNEDAVAQLIDELDAAGRGVFAPPDTETILEIIDILRSQNKNDEAARILKKSLEIAPTDEALQNLDWMTAGKRPLEHLRKDGIAAVREYLEKRQKDAAPEEGASTLILDYAATYIAPNGAKLGLTHTISRVLSKEGKNAVGEIYLPNSATALKVRTIKADTLETVEPEAIAFKNSVTAPNLAVGDFVETEYVTYEPPLSAYESRVASDSFFFASAQTPILRSEFVVEYPKSWDVQIVEAGPKADIRKTCAAHGDRMQCAFVRENCPAFAGEPNAPSEFDLIPNVQIYYKWGWNEIKRALRASVARQTRQTPYIQSYADKIEFDKNEPSTWKKAQTVYNFVLNSIRESAATHASDEEAASQTITRGVGSRLIALKAVYDALGMTNYFALIRNVAAPAQSADLPSLYESFYGTLLVVETEKGPAYADGSEDFIPFDYLPTSFQNQPVLPIDADIAEFTSRKEDISSMQPAIGISYEIAEDGSASAKAAETMRGARGLSMRAFLTSLKGDDVRTHLILENSLARNYGRVELTDLGVESLDDPDAPLTLRYDFGIASFASSDNGSLSVNSGIFAYRLVDQFAKLPASTRKYPVIVANDVLSKRSLVLNAPDGYAWNTQTLNDVRIETPFGKFERSMTASGRRLELRESIELLSQRVETSQYAEFRDFCLAVDEAQRTLIRAQRKD